MNRGQEIDRIKGEIIEAATGVINGQMQLLEGLREILFLRWLLDRLGYSGKEDGDVQNAWMALKAFQSQCAFCPLHQSPACFPREKCHEYSTRLLAFLNSCKDDIITAVRAVIEPLVSEQAHSAPPRLVPEMTEASNRDGFPTFSGTAQERKACEEVPLVPTDRRIRLRKRLISACRGGLIDEVRLLLDIMGDAEVIYHLGAYCENAFDAARNTEIRQLLLDTVVSKTLDGQNVENAMERAVEFGSAVHVKQLLERGARVEGEENNTWTHLMTALQDGHLETALCLIDAGADVNFLGVCDTTPLMVACGTGNLEAVRLLLDHGASGDRDQEGCDIVMHACHGGNVEVVRLILDGYSSYFLLKPSDAYGTTALMKAVKNGHNEVVRLLLEKGADVHHRNDQGETAFTLAEESGDQELMRLLEQYSGK